MRPFRIALIQMDHETADLESAWMKGEMACRAAFEMGADLALFPEMWSIGYRWEGREVPGAAERLAARAISREHAWFSRFQDLARELHMAIAVTYLEAWPGKPRNTVSIIDRTGTVVLTYAKAHLCSFDAEALMTHGDEFPVCELDTAHGLVKVGAMICFDREFPESARILMLNGAEVIIVPNACELEQLRLGQIQTRAYENMCAVAVANYPAPFCNGHSIVYDGISFGNDGVSRDMIAAQADHTEGVWLAELDMDALRSYREHEVWGNAYRRPEVYQKLLDPTIQPPFIRVHEA